MLFCFFYVSFVGETVFTVIIKHSSRGDFHTTLEAEWCDTQPTLNSRNITVMSLQPIAGVLSLSSTWSADQLRQCIEGRL